MNVITSPPCTRCGAPDSQHLDIVKGQLCASLDLCPPCMLDVLAEHAALRRQFDQLIAAGVDPAFANRIMMVRIDRDQAASGLTRRGR